MRWSTGVVNLMGQWRQANTGLQRYPRIALSVPIRVSTIDPEIDPNTGQPFFRSAEETTANLSRGGASLQSWEPLEPGRRVVVAIDLASGEELQLTGRVVWTRREIQPERTRNIRAPGYGIEFSGVSNRELSDLGRLIDSLAPASRSQRAPARSAVIATTSTTDSTTALTRP